MSQGFWENLKQPFFVLAPMADVTDAAFRRIIAARGKPDVLWSEFVSADGLVKAPESGRQKLLHDLMYTEAERPIVAQLFSADPNMMEQATTTVRELGFDGLDINMGCPDRSILRQGAGAALIETPERAKEIIIAARSGVRNELPISVKTRIGTKHNELENWLPTLLSTEPAAITIHARTCKDLSKVPARWETLREAVSIRDAYGSNTRIIGNGDVHSLQNAHERIEEVGCDGVMLGRAIFGNPWLFSSEVNIGSVILSERLTTLVEHTKLFEELLPHKNFSIMKKHYKAYVNGWEGAKELRMTLMDCENASDVEKTIVTYLDSHK